MEQNFSTGDIVLSKAGRDKGNYFVVMSLDDVFAEICDGDLRKADKPKKKKLKHLKSTGAYSLDIKDKISDGAKALPGLPSVHDNACVLDSGRCLPGSPRRPPSRREYSR